MKRGGAMAQVEAEIDGPRFRITSVMTLDSLSELGIAEGDVVRVVAKAVNVVLVKP